MPFELSELEVSDIDEFAELDALAMGNTDIGQAMEIDAQSKQGKPRKDLIKGWMVEALKNKDPENGVWIKITDPESHRMVAAAAWVWQLAPEKQKPSLHDEIAASEENPSVYAAMSRDWAAFKSEYFPSEPYCSE